MDALTKLLKHCSLLMIKIGSPTNLDEFGLAAGPLLDAAAKDAADRARRQVALNEAVKLAHTDREANLNQLLKNAFI